MGLTEYHCEFSGTANYLVSKHRMTSRKASIMYMSVFPVSVRPDITTQLTIKCPDVRPDDGYNLKDMMNAAQFVISSKPAIDLLAATTPLQPSVPAPAPQPPMAAYVTPAAVTPYVPDLPLSYAAQPYQQRPQYDGCTFCGASDHAIAACTVKAKYAHLGKIKIVNSCIQLLDGNSPFFEPYRSHGRFIQARIDRWILENPQQAPPTPTAILTASANLLSTAHTAETYAAEQKKGSMAMLKSRQPVPLPDKMPMATSS